MKKYDNSGSIRKNDKKEQPNHPDIRGKATIDGREYWISGWRKFSESGEGWYSLAFKAVEQKPEPRASDKRNADDIESDIPF